MARFKIIDIISITNRGYIIFGDITDKGSATVGDFALFQNEKAKIEVEIKGVEMVDFDNREKAKIGIMISLQDYQRIKDLKLKGLEIEILKGSKRS